MKTALGYIRVSSDEQEHGDGLRIQTSAIQTFCQQHGLALRRIVEDKGKSAFKKQHLKGQFGEILAGIKAGTLPEDVLVVENIDRIDRSNTGFFTEILEGGKPIGIVNDGKIWQPDEVDSEESISPAIKQILAKIESAKKRRRGLANWQEKREQASQHKTPTTSVCPRWLRRGGEGFVLNDYANTMKQACLLAIAGLGAGQIRQKLQIKDMRLLASFRSRALLGEFQPRNAKKEAQGKAIEGYYPPLLTTGEFYRLQTALDARKTQKSRRGVCCTNLFTGLLYDTAGEPLVVKRERHKATLVTQSAARNQGKYLAMDYKVVEYVVLRVFSEVLPADLYPQSENKERLALDEVEGKIAKAKHKITTLQSLLRETDDASVLGQSIIALEGDLRRLEGKREALRGVLASVKGADVLGEGQEMIEHLAGLEGEALLEARIRLKALIPALIKRVEVSRVGNDPKNLRLSVHLSGGKVIGWNGLLSKMSYSA